MYLNKASVLGNLVRDPELRSLPSGTKVATLSIATNRRWKDKTGALQESVEYHTVIAFGRQAETSAQFLKKGQLVLAEGRLATRSWDGRGGEKQYRTEIIADRVQFGAKANAGASTGDLAEASEELSDDELRMWEGGPQAAAASAEQAS
jgi:single-strand DNA-binding protein